MAGSSRKRNPSSTLLARARLRGVSQVQAYFRARPAQPGETISNRYRIEAEIGRGGFGHVYRASQIALGHRAVALKLIVPQCLEERGSGEGAEFFLKLFEKEALATSRLRHPNIVMVYDYGIWDKPPIGRLPYLVMELLEGRSLEQRLRDGPVSTEESIEFLRQILQGLQHAHGSRIQHLDLKPSNLFLDKSGLLKILDFGLARLDATEGQDAENGELWRQVLPYAATHCYLPPEQRDRRHRDVGSDLYALGCIVVDMLIGRQPGSAWTAEHRPLAVPIEALPDVIQQLVARALHVDPAKRFGSAEEFLLATEAVHAQLRGHAIGQLEPYRSLAPFDHQHSALFFGRQRNIAALRARVDANPFTILIGTSGAGKTSLLRAGLLPLLEESDWKTLLLEPGARPVASLLERLELSGCANVEQEQLLRNPTLAAEVLCALAEHSGKRILLVVDQLEECFTQCSSKVERGTFLSVLVAIADDTKGALRLLIAVREDFLSRLAEHRALIEKTDDNLILLRPPDADDLRAALCAPAALHSFTFEPGLADAVLNDFETDRHAAPLPILQLVATKLWEGRDLTTRRLRQATLAQVGGVAGVLAAHAETALGELRSAGERRIVPELFCALVTSEGTRRALAREHILDTFPADRSDAESVLERLISGRLLLSRIRDGEEVIELVHEALISRWATLRNWLNEDPVVRKLRQQLASDALTWHAQGRSADLLWKGDRLALVRQCGESLSHASVTDDFLLRSHQAARRRRIILLLAALTSLALLLALVVHERNRAALAAHAKEQLQVTKDHLQVSYDRQQRTQVELRKMMAEQVRLTQEKTEEVQKKKREIDRRLVTESELRATNAALERTAAKLAARADDLRKNREDLRRTSDALRLEGDAKEDALRLLQDSSPNAVIAMQSLKRTSASTSRRYNRCCYAPPSRVAIILRSWFGQRPGRCQSRASATRALAKAIPCGWLPQRALSWQM
jgi:serine/threonine protein kinase